MFYTWWPLQICIEYFTTKPLLDNHLLLGSVHARIRSDPLWTPFIDGWSRLSHCLSSWSPVIFFHSKSPIVSSSYIYCLHLEDVSIPDMHLKQGERWAPMHRGSLSVTYTKRHVSFINVVSDIWDEYLSNGCHDIWPLMNLCFYLCAVCRHVYTLVTAIIFALCLQQLIT